MIRDYYTINSPSHMEVTPVMYMACLEVFICWLQHFFSLVHAADEPPLLDDIAMAFEMSRFFEPCMSRGCMWPKSRNGEVQVPYYISNDFCESP